MRPPLKNIQPRPRRGGDGTLHAVLLILLFIAVMTAHSCLANINLDPHGDMVENYAWGILRHWGYAKHPPLFAWITAAWFGFFPRQDWAYYLLSAVNSGITVWLIWLIAGRYVAADRRLLSVAVAVVLPPIYFMATTYNASSAMLPFWAAVFLFYLRAIERQRLVDAILLGGIAGLAMLVKYHSAVLVAAIGLHVLFDPEVRKRSFLRLIPPGAAVLALILAPHVVWLFKTGFLPITYASQQGDGIFADMVRAAGRFIVALLLYALPGYLPVLFLRRPGDGLGMFPIAPVRALLSRVEGRALLSVAALNVVLTILFAFVAGGDVSSPWALPFFFVVPLIIVHQLPAEAVHRHLASALVAVFVFFAISVAIGPWVRWYHLSHPRANLVTPFKPMARAADQVWLENGGPPGFIVEGLIPESYAMAFYSQLHPLALQENSLELTGLGLNELRQRGVLAFCRVTDSNCGASAGLKVGQAGFEKRIEVPAFDGSEGPESYTLRLAGWLPD